MRRGTAGALIGLVLILGFDAWWRGHTFGPSVAERFGVRLWPEVGGTTEPLDCDEAVYAYIGRRLVGGDVMYRDLTENKPPGGYWLYALGVALGGANEWSIRLLPIPLVLTTVALVWWIGLRLAGGFAACLAALVYALASTDPYLYGNNAHLEHAINLGAVAALALVVRAWGAPGRPRRRLLAAAGACLGAACLVRQSTALHGPVFLLALAVRGGARPAEPASTDAAPTLAAKLLDALVFALGMLAVWGAAALAVVAQGAGPAAFDDIFRYGRALAVELPAEPNAPPLPVRWVTGNADPAGRLPGPFGQTDYLVWWGTGTWPLWLAAIPALIALAFGRGSTGPRRLLAAWTVSAWIQVALPRMFWAHYYLLPVPGLALAVAISAADGLARVRSAPGLAGRAARLAWLVALAVALGWVARVQVRDYLLTTPDEITGRFKGGRQWVVLRDLGRELGRRTRDWPERPEIFIWGWQSPLFLYSGLDCPSRQVFVDNLIRDFAATDHPLIRPRVERIMGELRADPPAFLFVAYPPFPGLKAFLDERYLPSARIRGLWIDRDKYVAFESSGGTANVPSNR